MYFNSDLQQRFGLAHLYRPTKLSNACWEHDVRERKLIIKLCTCKLKITELLENKRLCTCVINVSGKKKKPKIKCIRYITY